MSREVKDHLDCMEVDGPCRKCEWGTFPPTAYKTNVCNDCENWSNFEEDLFQDVAYVLQQAVDAINKDMDD